MGPGAVPLVDGEADGEIDGEIVPLVGDEAEGETEGEADGEVDEGPVRLNDGLELYAAISIQVMSPIQAASSYFVACAAVKFVAKLARCVEACHDPGPTLLYSASRAPDV
jgi:hypothetical protein